MSDLEFNALKPTLVAWAQITIKEWLTKAEVLNIHRGALVASFVNHVFWAAGNNIKKVEFAFLYYGRFVDMGVGRGVKFADREGSKRAEKPWFTKTFYKQVEVLRHLMAERMGEELPRMVAEMVDSNEKRGSR